MTHSNVLDIIPIPDEWVDPLDAFTERMLAADLSPGTIKLRRYQLRRFATTHPEPFSVTLDDITSYLSRDVWNANTRRSARAAIKTFYSWAAASGRLSVDPSTSAPKGRLTLGRPRPAPESAVELGLSTLDKRTRLMVRLGAHVGMRCCEIAVLHTSDLTEGVTGWTLRVHGKGRKIRLVPVSDAIASTIRALPEGYVFAGQIDGHLSAAYVSKLISRALPEGVTAHMLRHRYGSRAFNLGGKDIRAVQELLGHSSVATTQIYTAVEDDSLRRASLAAA